MSTIIQIIASFVAALAAIAAINIGEHLGGGWDFWLTIVGVLISYFYGYHRGFKASTKETP